MRSAVAFGGVFGVLVSLIPPLAGRTWLCGCTATFMEGVSEDVIGDIGPTDLYSGSADPDRSDEKLHVALLTDKDMLDSGPDL